MKIFLLIIFIATASSIHVGCRFVYWTYSDILIESKFTCRIQSMDFSLNSTHIMSANATREELEMVKILDFGEWDNNCAQMNLTFIPRGFLNVFPNFTGFTFSNCPITNFVGNELDEYQNLEIFLFQQRNIQHIPGNLFASNPKTRFVGFRNTDLRSVGDVFTNLENLERADFRSNFCINQIAYNSSQIQSLTQALREQCPDIETTTTSTDPPRCEIPNLNDFVCGLDEEIEELNSVIEDLREENRIQDEKLQIQGERLDELERVVAELQACACPQTLP